MFSPKKSDLLQKIFFLKVNGYKRCLSCYYLLASFCTTDAFLLLYDLLFYAMIFYYYTLKIFERQ